MTQRERERERERERACKDKVVIRTKVDFPGGSIHELSLDTAKSMIAFEQEVGSVKSMTGTQHGVAVVNLGYGDS